MEDQGVGRALGVFELQVFAQGEDGALEAAGPKILPTSTWVAGCSYTVKYCGRIDRLPDSLRGLRFALRDPATGRRIALPLNRAVGERQYQICGDS